MAVGYSKQGNTLSRFLLVEAAQAAARSSLIDIARNG
jgi:hypothetical protein